MINIKAVPVPGELFCIQAEDGEKVVGYVLGTEIPKELAYIWHLRVDPAYRRKGHGRNLVETLKKLYPVVATQILTSDSRKLFKKMGFKREHKEIIWRESGSI